MSCKTMLCKSYRGNRIDKLKTRTILCDTDCMNNLDGLKCKTLPFKAEFGNRIERLKCKTILCNVTK